MNPAISVKDPPLKAGEMLEVITTRMNNCLICQSHAILYIYTCTKGESPKLCMAIYMHNLGDEL